MGDETGINPGTSFVRNMTLRLFLSILCCTTVIGSGCSNEVDPLSKAIGRVVREERTTELRLIEVTPFTWDKVYFFGPYAQHAAICSTLEIKTKDCDRIVSVASVDDGEMTIAFVTGKNVVHYALHTRWNGDFSPVPKSQPILREAAVFRVIVDGEASDGSPWYRLALLPEKSNEPDS